MTPKQCAVRLVFLLLTIGGCQQPTEPASNVAEQISAALHAGETQAAEQLCKQAIRQDPDNPKLRKLYGDIYLAMENGRNAEIAFRKAVALGANADELLTRIGRALLLQGEYFKVLSLEGSGGWSDAAAQTEMALIRLRAELQLPGGDAADLRRTVSSLIRSLDSPANPEPWVTALLQELEALRVTQPPVAAALAHARCRRPAVEDYFSRPASNPQQPAQSIIRVGATRDIKTPAAASKIATDGALIEIDAGEYPGGVALWPQNNLTIRGVGGRPHVSANGKSIEDRDIWLFSGDNIVVENIEFSGARAKRSHNGAGIRHMGSDLIVRHSFFHDSDNGILTWKSATGRIIIEYSEFARHGFGDGLSHNVYVGETAKLTFRYNYSHASKEGHLLKTRARTNEIRYNRLSGEAGEVSYVIDIPNGGIAYVIGNVIEKAVTSKNPYAITFGQEGLPFAENRLFVVNNSVYNRYDKTVLVRNAAETSAYIANNLVGGVTAGLVVGPHEALGNRLFAEHGMVDPPGYDFELTPTAGAIDSASELNQSHLVPEAEYVHPVSMRPRAPVAGLDVGAHEFCANSP